MAQQSLQSLRSESEGEGEDEHSLRGDEVADNEILDLAGTRTLEKLGLTARGKELLDEEAIARMLEKSEREHCCRNCCMRSFTITDVLRLRMPHAHMNMEERRSALASYEGVKAHKQRQLAGDGSNTERLKVEGNEVCMEAFKRLFHVSKNLWHSVLEESVKSAVQKGHMVRPSDKQSKVITISRSSAAHGR